MFTAERLGRIESFRTVGGFPFRNGEDRMLSRRKLIQNAALIAGTLAVAEAPDALAAPAGKTGAPAAIASGYVDVSKLGAVGNGVHDDTDAFEKAISESAKTNQPVYVPRATYRTTRPLRIANQLLMGQFAGGWPADTMPMPTLRIDHLTGPGIEMGAGASIHGIAIEYDINAKFPSVNPPPAISLNGNGPSISSVRIQYPYDGIMTAPEGTPGRSRLSDIFIVSPKHSGLYLTKCYDVSQLRNIEVWCNIGFSTGPGFHFGRNDDCALTDLFAFQCQIAYLFETDTDKGGGRFYGSLSNCSSDACSQGYVIHGDHQLNIAASDLVDHFTSMEIDGENASVRIGDSVLQTNGAATVHLVNCASFSVSNCRFLRSFQVPAHHFIHAEKCGSLTVNGCQFPSDSPGIQLDAGVQRAVITNNIFEATFSHLTDNTTAATKKVIAQNVAEDGS